MISLPTSRPRFRSSRLFAGVFCLCLGSALSAQDGRPERGREGGREGGGMRMNPIFAALDTNGDGVIDESEIQAAAVSLKKLDRNQDGKITDDEVRPSFPRGGPGEGRGPGGRGGAGAAEVEEIVKRMLQFDQDGDGFVSKSELPERMARMMERGDTNKDGKLSREELTELARAQAGGGGREQERR